MNEKIDPKDIKKIQLESLVILKEFCNKHHLKYYLGFGTLIGAIRHKGYIPWDDDIDVIMPREDYNFLVHTFNLECDKDHKLISKEIDNKFYLNIAKIINTKTVAVEHNQTYEIGIWIDIFPMEPVPKNIFKRLHLILNVKWINYLLDNISIKVRKGRKWYKNLYVRFFHLFRPFKNHLEKKRNKLINPSKKIKYKDRFVFLYRRYGRYVLEFDKNVFEPSKEMEFENNIYRVPNNSDYFLSYLYGDYMKLPDEVEQVSHHSYTCYWKEESK